MVTMHKILSVGRHLKTYNVGAHKHEEWELVYVLSGDGAFVSSDNCSCAYSAGEIVCIPPRLTHSNIGGEQGFTNLHMLIDNIALNESSFTKISDNTSKILHDIFSQAHYFFNCDLSYKFLMLKNLGELIGDCLYNFLSDSPPFHPLVEKIRLDIIKNYSDAHFDLQTVLNSANNNPEYLRKLFKKETNTTPLQYLTGLRIENAKKLLKQNCLDININEIARDCGFADALYFSRIFKKHTGLSPSAFIKKD